MLLVVDPRVGNLKVMVGLIEGGVCTSLGPKNLSYIQCIIFLKYRLHKHDNSNIKLSIIIMKKIMVQFWLLMDYNREALVILMMSLIIVENWNHIPIGAILVPSSSWTTWWGLKKGWHTYFGSWSIKYYKT